jgi:hypothetical protein
VQRNECAITILGELAEHLRFGAFCKATPAVNLDARPAIIPVGLTGWAKQPLALDDDSRSRFVWRIAAPILDGDIPGRGDGHATIPAKQCTLEIREVPSFRDSSP